MPTARELPSHEWPKLAGTAVAWRELDPARSRVIVVEDGHAILGCQVLTWLLHAGPLLIAPNCRGKIRVGKAVWTKAQQTAKALGSTTLITGTIRQKGPRG